MKTAQEKCGGSLRDLTQREFEALSLLDEGLKRREIAVRLNISLHTVDSHLNNLYSKLNVHSATAALSRLHTEGFLSLKLVRSATKPDAAEKSMDPSIAQVRCNM